MFVTTTDCRNEYIGNAEARRPSSSSRLSYEAFCIGVVNSARAVEEDTTLPTLLRRVCEEAAACRGPGPNEYRRIADAGGSEQASDRRRCPRPAGLRRPPRAVRRPTTIAVDWRATGAACLGGGIQQR